MSIPLRIFTILLLPLLVFSQAHDPAVVPGIYIVELKEESAASFAMHARTTAQARRTVMHSRRGSVRASQQAFRKAAGIADRQVLSSMDVLHNAITVRMSESQIARLRGHRLVKEIYPVHEMVSSADKALGVLKIPEVWQSLGGFANAGAGIKIGIVDTGIDETHPAFQAPSLAIPPGFPKYDNVADIGQTNNKVIVARNYTAALVPAVVDLEDQVGHGTGVAMAAAGMPHTGPEGTSLSGVAPGAWLGNYKVGIPTPLTASGNSRGDVILKALNDAAADGMDVINLSFAIQGSWLGLASEAALYDSAAKRLAALGILFVVAAGNDGPERNSIGSSPSYAHLLVGGSTNSRLLGGNAGLSDGSSYVGIPPSPPYVLPAAPVSGVLINVADLEPTGKGCGPYAAGSLANRVALIRNLRTCSVDTFLTRMAAAGAVGALIYVDGFLDPPQFSTTATIPVMAIGFGDGDAIVTKLHNTPGLTATLTLARNPIPVNPNRIAGLSARGPDPNYAIRPDFVTVAQYVYTAAPGSAFQFVSGTSFAAPLAAGGAAILRGTRPNLTVDQYFSLLTNTATPLTPDGQKITPVMEQGAGRMNVDAALKSTLTASPRSLSFNYGPLNVNQTLPFSVTNIGQAADTLQLSIQSIDGVVTPTLSAASVPLAAGQSTSVNLTLAATGLAPGEYQGFVRVRGATSEIRIPYWYGVASSTPQFMKVFTQSFVQAGSAVSGLFYFRITDAIGIPIGGSPTVTVVSGGATNVNTFVYSGTRNLFYANATLGPTPGDNIFRVTLGGFTRDVWVTTTAAGAPKADASDLFFGDVLAGTSKDLTLTVLNLGTGPLNVSTMSISDTQFRFTSPIGPFTLAAGATQNFNVRFTPSKPGPQAGVLNITSNDPNFPNLSRSMRGVGISPGGPMSLQLDGGAYSETIGFTNGAATAYFVNRITPPKYPATLKQIEIYFGNRANGLPLGAPLTLLAAANPSGSSTINGLAFQTRSENINRLDSVNSYTAPEITVNSGDFVVGMQVNNPANTFPVDSDIVSAPQRRSYTSTDGTNFSLEPDNHGIFMIRATVAFPGGCSFTLTQTSASVSAAGDNGRIQLTASSPSCSWTAQSSAPWLTLNGGGLGQGSGAIAFSAAANPSAVARSGVITLEGSSVTVLQPANGCNFVLSTQSISIPAAGGPTTLGVSTSPACNWTATTQPNWNTITTGSITGNGNIGANATANNATVARTGSVQVGGVQAQLLQPSTNPLQPFQDVPAGNGFEPFISIMRFNAITAGCTITTYCPDSTTTRGQMAVFIVRALMGDSFDFQAGPYFTDVPAAHPFFKYIQKMRQLGITSGCTATTYCPDTAVTRGQMAVFIVRARLALQPGATLFFPQVAFFTDTASTHQFFSFIQKMRQLGVTTGCTESTYCPDDPTTRAQMSVFIVRGLLTP